MIGTNLSTEQLKSIVERIERLEEEKKTIAADIKEVYAEAKGNGFDTKILRKVITAQERRQRARRRRVDAGFVSASAGNACGHTAGSRRDGTRWSNAIMKSRSIVMPLSVLRRWQSPAGCADSPLMRSRPFSPHKVTAT